MENNLVSQKYRFLSGSVLKIIAVATMLIDHTASVLLARNAIGITVLGHSVRLYTVMRLIGRMAFPIYAFLITEGFIHTRNRKRYGINLLVFAFVSEIPWNLEHSGEPFLAESQNVFFTLLFGYLGICMIEKYKGKIGLQAVWLIALLIISTFAHCDYGAIGFALILMLYLLRDYSLLQTVIGTALLSKSYMTIGVFAGFASVNLYNGRRGFIKGSFLKYLFYAIYPAHMLVLYYLKKKYIGY